MIATLSHELSTKFAYMSASFDDLRVLLAGCDLPSTTCGASSGQVLPIVDDIRRSVDRLRSDLGSWSAASDRNSELIGAIAPDLRDLASRTSDCSNFLHPAATLEDSRNKNNNINNSKNKKTNNKNNNRNKRIEAAKSSTSHANPEVTATPSDSTVAASSTAVAAGSGPDLPCLIPGQNALGIESSESSGLVQGAITIRPARLPRSVFISRIHPDTTEGEVVDHLSSRIGAPHSMIACRRINSQRCANNRSFTASFKVLVPEELFQATLSPDIWPNGSIVREFIPRSQPGSRTMPKNWSRRSRSTTPT